MTKKSFKSIGSTAFVPKKRVSKKRLFALVFSLCLLSALISGSLVYVIASPGAGVTTIVEEGSMVETASYVLFREDSTYYAKNGKTGVIDYSGGLAGQVINNALSSGFSVYLKAATYFLGTTQIVLPSSGRKLLGEGSDNTVLDYRGSGGAIYMTQATTDRWYIEIADLTIDLTSNTNDDCIGMSLSCSFSVYKNLVIKNPRLYGIDLDAMDRGAFNNYFNNIRVLNNAVNCTKGLYAHSTGELKSNNNHFIGGVFDAYANQGYYFTTGVHIDSGEAWEFIGTDIEGASSELFQDSGGEANQLLGCYLTLSEDVGIYISSETYDFLMLGGILGTTISGSKVINYGARTKIRNVWGFTTEKSGTALGSSPILVAHGLAGEADYVTLGIVGTVTYETSWNNVNATHFYIYHDSASTLSVTWYAEYLP